MKFDIDINSSALMDINIQHPRGFSVLKFHKFKINDKITLTYIAENLKDPKTLQTIQDILSFNDLMLDLRETNTFDMPVKGRIVFSVLGLQLVCSGVFPSSRLINDQFGYFRGREAVRSELTLELNYDEIQPSTGSVE